MNPNLPCDQYSGVHDGRRMQMHTVALSEQDSLVGYIEDDVLPAIAATIAEIGSGAALVGVASDQTSVEAAHPGLIWSPAGAFLVTVIGDNAGIRPVYNALTASMLARPYGALQTVFGLTTR